MHRRQRGAERLAIGIPCFVVISTAPVTSWRRSNGPSAVLQRLHERLTVPGAAIVRTGQMIQGAVAAALGLMRIHLNCTGVMSAGAAGLLDDWQQIRIRDALQRRVGRMQMATTDRGQRPWHHIKPCTRLSRSHAHACLRRQLIGKRWWWWCPHRCRWLWRQRYRRRWRDRSGAGTRIATADSGSAGRGPVQRFAPHWAIAPLDNYATGQLRHGAIAPLGNCATGQLQ